MTMIYNRQISPGSTNISLDVFIGNSSVTTGAGLTGLVFNSAGLTCYYRRGGVNSPVAVTLASLAAVTTAHTDGGFIELDATNMPGLYRLDLPDAAVALGATECTVFLKGATNMRDTAAFIELPQTETAVVVSPTRTLYLRPGGSETTANNIVSLVAGVTATIAMDFSEILNPGTRISSISSVTDASGNGATLNNNAVSQDGHRAHFDISGLSAATTYTPKVTVVTTDTQTLIGTGDVQTD